MRDPDTGNSKGFAFINFGSFDSSDAAIEAMNGQYLCNRAITISYAFKKDAKGERHGSAAGGCLTSHSLRPTVYEAHIMLSFWQNDEKNLIRQIDHSSGFTS